MVANLVYRTDDITRWGGGQGSDLDPAQVDINFWTLWSAIEALEDHQDTVAGIDYISQPVNGNQFFIHLTNHAVLGPITIPTAQWNPRGVWQPNTPYNAFDTVSYNGQLYLVTIAHTSGSTFSANATDGHGHLLYVLILSAPGNALPEDGLPGMRLTKKTGSPFVTQWEYDLIRLALFIGGQPLGGELLMQFGVVDTMTFPVGLAGSVVYAGIAPAAAATFTLLQNNNSIGTITFNPSGAPTVSFSTAINCVPGDVITLIAPTSPDTNLANLSFTFVADLTE